MVENSSAGLVMVGGEVSVTVTKEDRHQAALALYRAGATVAVELGWCVIESGKYRGERAVEVRLDGRRVGELTFLMSQRYGPIVSQVAAGGGRAGCEAVIESGAKGLEIVLRLPREGRAAIPVPPVTPEETTIVMAPVGAVPAQVAAVSARPKFLSSRPFWIAAAVFALIVFFGIIGSAGEDEEPPAAGPAAETTSTTSVEPTTTTTTPPPTTTTTTTPPPAPKPKPKITTEEPAPPPPPPAPEPEPEPEPVSNCDPNYSGCVPVAEDVDCAGGSGNGPAYVQGPVQVIGNDIYGLDSNNDGVGCES